MTERKTQKATDMGWDEVQANFITFDEPGQEVVGRVKAMDKLTIHDRTVWRMTLEGEEGDVAFLLTTQLERLLANVPAGTLVKIRYEGMGRTAQGRRMKQFRVWVRRE
jgi:hypothetical protein